MVIPTSRNIRAAIGTAILDGPFVYWYIKDPERMVDLDDPCLDARMFSQDTVFWNRLRVFGKVDDILNIFQRAHLDFITTNPGVYIPLTRDFIVRESTPLFNAIPLSAGIPITYTQNQLLDNANYALRLGQNVYWDVYNPENLIDISERFLPSNNIFFKPLRIFGTIKNIGCMLKRSLGEGNFTLENGQTFSIPKITMTYVLSESIDPSTPEGKEELDKIQESKRRYRRELTEELTYLPPYGQFPGGQEYQQALSRFHQIQKYR